MGWCFLFHSQSWCDTGLGMWLPVRNCLLWGCLNHHLHLFVSSKNMWQYLFQLGPSSPQPTLRTQNQASLLTLYTTDRQMLKQFLEKLISFGKDSRERRFSQTHIYESIALVQKFLLSQDVMTSIQEAFL